MKEINSVKKGITNIQVRCIAPKKFINLLWENDIPVLKVKKNNITTITMKVYTKDLYKIFHMPESKDVEVKVLSREGLSYLSYKIKNRKTFIFGAVVFVFIIYYFSTYIWSIGIKTESNIAPYEIRQQLKSYGIRPGIRKKDFNIFNIENKVMSDNDEIAWAKVRIEGTKLQIDIIERQTPPNIEKDNTPCDLIAKRDGVIMKVYTKLGTSLVTEGEVVKKGQVVVSGEQGNEGSKNLVHAEGNILAKTFYEEKENIDFSKVKRIRTGNIMVNKYIIFTGKRIYVKNSLNKFKSYDKIEDNKSFIKKDIYYEVREEKYSKENLNKILQDEFNKLYTKITLNFNKSIKVLEKIKDVKRTGDIYTIRLVLTAEEDIGETKLIDLSNRNEESKPIKEQSN